jgi:hypothetical protein
MQPGTSALAGFLLLFLLFFAFDAQGRYRPHREPVN